MLYISRKDAKNKTLRLCIKHSLKSRPNDGFSINFGLKSIQFKMIRYIIFLLLGSILFTSCKRNNEEPYVVILSMDAFRWDYPDKVPTPNLDYIAKHGVKAKSLKPCFPTKTFPNHYSMATGLFPDNHGIVQNSFYDEEMDSYYYISNRDAVENPEFYGGEPIWVTAEKQGVTSASFYWVGSEAPIMGIQPTYWKRYDHDFPFEDRLDTVIKWLQLPEDIRPHLIMWYMHEPDAVGHDFGPDSDSTMSMIMYLDSLLGVFLNKLEQLPIKDQLNFIVTSDHGMCSTNEERVVIIGDYVDSEWFEEIEGYNPNFLLKVKDGYLDTAYSILSNIEHIQAWKHDEVPEYLNYGHNPRTMDIVIVADSSWTVEWKERNSYGLGAHGYDNTNSDMHAIFYALGPVFKENYKHPGFENIDLYPLMAYILNLQATEVDGSLENVEEMIKK